MKQTPSQWFQTAQPKDQIIYHSSNSLAVMGGDRLSREARELYDRGLVELVQRRNGTRFDYIAIKRKCPAKIMLEHTFKWAEERMTHG